eukprot:TRINITY_DN471_c0_g1_i6.p1 TRINITY_DN471_c0_g1~~TRINITY_DN471_c0_g1_i6.p1  ORF type:complete len:458 (+),score=97.51 TRINITY_DN471_c0_g1_i6:198-1376(+)
MAYMAQSDKETAEEKASRYQGRLRGVEQRALVAEAEKNTLSDTIIRMEERVNASQESHARVLEAAKADAARLEVELEIKQCDTKTKTITSSPSFDDISELKSLIQSLKQDRRKLKVVAKSAKIKIEEEEKKTKRAEDEVGLLRRKVQNADNLLAELHTEVSRQQSITEKAVEEKDTALNAIESVRFHQSRNTTERVRNVMKVSKEASIQLNIAVESDVRNMKDTIGQLTSEKKKAELANKRSDEEIEKLRNSVAKLQSENEQHLSNYSAALEEIERLKSCDYSAHTGEAESPFQGIIKQLRRRLAEETTLRKLWCTRSKEEASMLHMIQEKFNKSEAANQQYILVIEGLRRQLAADQHVIFQLKHSTQEDVNALAAYSATSPGRSRIPKREL